MASASDDSGGTELRHLRYFAAVAEAGTITEAARRLRIAQPSLSQQIRSLERRIGVELFRRSAHGMELTGAGRALRDGVRQVFDALDSAVAAARDAPLSAAVGVCSGVPSELISRVEAALGEAWRSESATPLEICFEPVDSARQAELLRRGELDFGLVRRPIADDGLKAVTVSDEPLGVVVHGSHPLASRTTVDWADLAGQNLLWFPDSRAPGYAATILAHLDRQGWAPEVVRARHTSHALFVHNLRNDTVVALRPSGAVADIPELVWLPFAADPPRERLALATTSSSTWAPLLVAAAKLVG
ncbi:LysR family transcriptional regulator [Saccharopolyspora sp. NPDC050389]|uniref:LysR family transcriptional regulator n=1 Tax=Saccharopolyspora sp. NPDC050389 TaxID=3155516 RepID=UPI0033E9EBB2